MTIFASSWPMPGTPYFRELELLVAAMMLPSAISMSAAANAAQK